MFSTHYSQRDSLNKHINKTHKFAYLSSLDIKRIKYVYISNLIRLCDKQITLLI